MSTQRTEKGEAPVIGPTEASVKTTVAIKHKELSMEESKAVQVSSQPVFNFGDHSVRVVVRDGEPWFVASDVCKALEISNSRDALLKLTADEKGVGSADTLGGTQEMALVSESGMYTLVLRCRDAVKAGTVPFMFRKWVTGEVLPAIRKTGVYVGKPFTVNPGDVLSAEEQNTLRLMLKSAVEKLPKAKQAGAMVQGWSKLKAHFGVPYREIPRLEFSEAVSIIARHAAEWDLVENAPAALAAPSIDRTRSAFDAATQAAASVQTAVFNAVIEGNDEWKYSRWMLAFIDDSAKAAPAYVRQMDRDSFVTTWPRLIKDVATGDCMCTSAELIEMASACMQRLQQRSGPVQIDA